MAHEEPSGEAVDVVAERVDTVLGALDQEACQRVDLAFGHAPAPVVVAEDGDGRLLLRNEQEQRLVAADRPLVVERFTAAGELPAPAAEAIAASERSGPRLADHAQLGGRE